MQSKAYRSDIDGLRSVAVLSVILFHVGMPGFSGGYVGVDVFFVISGYLITGIIRAEVEQGSFSILSFYERRIRRIVPVLLLVVAVTLLSFYVLKMSPYDFAALTESSAAVAFFVPNYFFMSSLTGYFADSAENQPLLHTWSLGVEEQFYIVFPLIVIAVRKTPLSWMLSIMLAVFFVSLAYSEWMLRIDDTRAFFGFPSRAWELMTGALLTFVPKRLELHRRVMRASSYAGLTAIFCAVFFYGNETAFPGFAALLPVLGSALLLFGGSQEGGQLKVLSHPLSVGIGRISYSMYLWHWPVIVAIKHYNGNDVFAIEHQLMAIAITFGLSIASWGLVEQPFRKKRILASRKGLYAAALGSMSCLAVTGLVVSSLDGLPKRFPQEISILADRDYWRNPDIEECLFRSDSSALYESASNFDSFCSIGEGDESPSYLLWGDSHAEAIREALAIAGDTHGLTGVFAGYAACPPLLGVQRLERSKTHGCLEFNQSVIRLIERSEIDLVFLHARWAFNYHGSRYGDEPGKSAVIAPTGIQDNAAYFEERIEETVLALQHLGVRVVIIAGVPEVGVNVPQALIRSALRDEETAHLPLLSTVDYRRRYAEVLSGFENLQEQYSVDILRPDRLLCDVQYCRVSDDSGHPLYTDAHHLSWLGARFLVPLFYETFAETSGETSKELSSEAVGSAKKDEPQ